MAENRYGCAVVVEGAKVVGVFTVTDGMNALADLLGKAPEGVLPPPEKKKAPARKRA